MVSLKYRWISFEERLRLYEISAYLVNVEPLRVGRGRGRGLAELSDLPVIKVRIKDKDVPFIPGSSLKGSFRSEAIRLAAMKGVLMCSGLSRQTCLDRVWGEEKGTDILERLLREHKLEEAKKLFWENACLGCKIFGAPGVAGKVTFSDAYPVSEEGEILPFSIGVKPGIAIDRRTGAVYRGALFDVEFIEPGARFKFLMRVTNLPNYAMGILASILFNLNEGIVKLGGFKTRGFGRVKVEDLRVRVHDFAGEGRVLKALDEYDNDVEVVGYPHEREEDAWRLLREFKRVWEVAEVPSPQY